MAQWRTLADHDGGPGQGRPGAVTFLHRPSARHDAKGSVEQQPSVLLPRVPPLATVTSLRYRPPEHRPLIHNMKRMLK